MKLEILRRLGAGGMATVYSARMHDGARSRRVAVKKPHPHCVEDPACAALFAEEARVGRRIDHPNVVRVLELVEGDDPAIVMELVEGVDLSRLVRTAASQGQRLPVDVASAIARDVLAGLEAAHAIKVVHRDVSPQNVLVGLDGVARLADFGAARTPAHATERSLVGKLGYLAPEQLDGSADERTDIYGLGAVLWELLTCARLRRGDGVAILVEIVAARAEAPSTRASEAARLDAVVLRALARYPWERFETAGEMRAALEGAVTPASPRRVAEVVRTVLRAPAPLPREEPTLRAAP